MLTEEPISTRLIAIVFLILAGTCVSFGQVSVAFLQHPPAIDGTLDDDLRALVPQPFTVVIPEDGPASPAKPAYRIAYGAGFLYLYIEVNDASVIDRDRAYQNGDGFQLALTRPRPGDAPTDEFYVMGFSTSPEASKSWRSKFVWYRNVDLAFTPLKSAVLASAVKDGKTSIELLLPWTEVYPYHPWLSDSIGFNLSYVKATGETAKTNYFVVADDRLQSEQSLRRYMRLEFQKPQVAEGSQAYAILERNHAERGEAVQAKLAIVSAGASQFSVRVRVLSGEGTVVDWRNVAIDAAPGLTVHTVAIPADDLPPGGYTVAWSAPVENASSAQGLSILPVHDNAQLKSRLDGVKSRIKSGSFTTMQFQLEEIESSLARLKPYDTATGQRMALSSFLDTLEAATQGRDLIATRAGIQRRAYRSKVDGTPRPYSVRIPETLQPGRKYPLIVYLHGSGEDDRGQLDRSFFPTDAILLAPNGRGTSNAYTTDHAQDDIREAIEDVLANYPADSHRIILTGFSMGGYGVYRTFYEDPSRYRALAVFSGHPDIGRSYAGGDQPNFLDPKMLAPFRGVPIFIFHGGRDRNCPIELTRELVAKLEASGAKVQFHYEAEKGHEIASPETLESFQQWLKEVVE
jgi:predicted esterase